MRSDQRPEVGGIVHLRPTTKTAGRECRAMLEAKVLSYADWPIVLVGVEETAGRPRQVRVHADDCGLHPARQKSAGDQAGVGTRKVPTLRADRRKLELGPGEEELTLW